MTTKKTDNSRKSKMEHVDKKESEVKLGFCIVCNALTFHRMTDGLCLKCKSSQWDLDEAM